MFDDLINRRDPVTGEPAPVELFIVSFGRVRAYVPHLERVGLLSPYFDAKYEGEQRFFGWLDDLADGYHGNDQLYTTWHAKDYEPKETINHMQEFYAHIERRGSKENRPSKARLISDAIM